MEALRSLTEGLSSPGRRGEECLRSRCADPSVVPQAVALIRHPLRGFDNQPAFISEPLKTLASFDNRHTQFRFQLLDCGGQGRLGNVASRGGACKVAFFGERHQIFQFPAKHEF